MEAFIGILSTIGFLVCIIMVIVSAIRKNGKVKKWGIGIAICFVGFIVAFAMSSNPTSPASPTAATVSEKTPEQIAQEKADAEAKAALEEEAKKISESDKELLKKPYSTFSEQQVKQFKEIKEKYKNLPNAEVADISADFARVSNEEAVEEKKKAEAKAAADKAAADAKAAAEAKAAYQSWVDGQFSAWDGSNVYLVDLLKENLNDPKSFDHEETKYWDMGDHVIIKMTYRAKNAFGGLILQNVTAKADYKTDTISIISQND